MSHTANYIIVHSSNEIGNTRTALVKAFGNGRQMFAPHLNVLDRGDRRQLSKLIFAYHAVLLDCCHSKF